MNNKKFVEYLEVCKGIAFEASDKDTIINNKLEFKPYFDITYDYNELEDVVYNFYQLSKKINDKEYKKLIEITKESMKVYYKYCGKQGEAEAVNRLFNIEDELAWGTVNDWSKLNKVSIGARKFKIDGKFYRCYTGEVGINIMTMICSHKDYKDKHIGLIVYKDNQELVYELNDVKDLKNIVKTLKNFKFDYDFAIITGEFIHMLPEFERYLVGKGKFQDVFEEFYS